MQQQLKIDLLAGVLGNRGGPDGSLSSSSSSFFFFTSTGA
jgi:hypothetical protein